jgi:biopolymer transport protein TolQ
MAQVFRAGYQELVRLTRNGERANPADRSAANGVGEIENIELAMRRVIREQVRWLERALTFLATTGSTAPFIGLFGTVWGIMNAFQGLSMVQSTSLQAVAPGIAEALVATAVGLAAAIPAVMAYNHFRRQVRLLAADLEHFAVEFLHLTRHHFL